MQEHIYPPKRPNMDHFKKPEPSVASEERLIQFRGSRARNFQSNMGPKRESDVQRKL